jgi:hypothetical protein
MRLYFKSFALQLLQHVRTVSFPCNILQTPLLLLSQVGSAHIFSTQRVEVAGLIVEH